MFHSVDADKISEALRSAIRQITAATLISAMPTVENMDIVEDIVEDIVDDSIYSSYLLCCYASECINTFSDKSRSEPKKQEGVFD